MRMYMHVCGTDLPLFRPLSDSDNVEMRKSIFHLMRQHVDTSELPAVARTLHTFRRPYKCYFIVYQKDIV